MCTFIFQSGSVSRHGVLRQQTSPHFILGSVRRLGLGSGAIVRSVPATHGFGNVIVDYEFSNRPGHTAPDGMSRGLRRIDPVSVHVQALCRRVRRRVVPFDTYRMFLCQPCIQQDDGTDEEPRAGMAGKDAEWGEWRSHSVTARGKFNMPTDFCPWTRFSLGKTLAGVPAGERYRDALDIGYYAFKMETNPKDPAFGDLRWCIDISQGIERSHHWPEPRTMTQTALLYVYALDRVLDAEDCVFNFQKIKKLHRSAQSV